MNPFSGFLQPQYRTIQGAPSITDLSRLQLARQEAAQQAQQAQDSSQRDWKRIGLYEKDQTFNQDQALQKQRESLLAEYQQAEDQGDPVRMNRAKQMLQRFGMNVGQGGERNPFTGLPAPKAEPGMLSQEEFERKLIAGSEQRPDVQAFTGQDPNAELSQDDFEKQLIAGSGQSPVTEAAVDEYTPPPAEEEIPLYRQYQGKPVKLEKSKKPTSDARLKKALRGELATYGASPAAETDTTEATQPEAPIAHAEPLSTSALPRTVVTQGDKTLYESSGPSGRLVPMVAKVFQPYTQDPDPEFAALGNKAQDMAMSLVTVDGYSPKDAIDTAMKQYESDKRDIVNYRRTELGSNARRGSGGGGAAVPAMKGRKPFNDEMNRTYMQFRSEKLDEQFQGYNAGIGAISSANTASQYDSLNRLIQARSGLTVSDKERAIYNNLAGLWNKWLKDFNLLTGGALPEEYKSQLQGLMSEARQAVIEEKQRRAKAAGAFYRAKTRGADPADVDQDAKAVEDAVMMGVGDGGAAASPPGESYDDLAR